MKKATKVLIPALMASPSTAQQPPVPSGFEFASGMPAYDQAYQKARRTIAGDVKDGAFLAGENWAQVWTRDTSYSVDMACALLHPEISKKTLLGLSESVDGIGECWYQDKCGHFDGWPNLTDAIVGANGAWSLYLVTGDRELLRPVYNRTLRSLKRAERDAFNQELGLFGGCSTFMESNSGYPAPYAMKGAKIAKTYALSTNLLYYRAYVIAAEQARMLGENAGMLRHKAERLKQTINQRLWMPEKGYYAYFLTADGQQESRMEGCGEAFAILYEVVDESKAASILRQTPVSPMGYPCLWPQFEEWKDYKRNFAHYYHNGMIWPFTQGYWAWAASRMKNSELVGRELESLVKLSQKSDTFMEFYFPEDGAPGGSPRQLWSASGFLSMIYHGLFGMEFEEQGLRFSPVVPGNLNEISLTDVKYRQCQFSITIKGHGTAIDRFELDGQKQSVPILAANLTGSHRIEIQMK